MPALVCDIDICGGKLVVKQGGLAVCDRCGLEHSKERLREKLREIEGAVEDRRQDKQQDSSSQTPAVILKGGTADHIPAKYTDAALERERKRLVKLIADGESWGKKLEGDIAQIRVDSRKDEAREAEQRRKRDWEREKELEKAKIQASLQQGTMEGLYHRARIMQLETNAGWSDDTGANYYAEKASKNIRSLTESLAKNSHDLVIAREDLEEIKVLLLMKPSERLERDYGRFCEDYRRFDKNATSTEDQFDILASSFREMEDYKNAAALANECAVKAVEKKYNRLVQEFMKTPTKEEEFQELAKQFRQMNGYKNTEEYANKCEQKHQDLKSRREEQERIDRIHREEQEKKEQKRRAAEERKRRTAERWRKIRRTVARSFKILFIVALLVFIGVVIYDPMAIRDPMAALSRAKLSLAKLPSSLLSNEGAKNEVRAAKLPSPFPSDIPPLYAGLAQTSLIPFGESRARATFKGKGDPATIQRYYREQMPKYGWRETKVEGLEGMGEFAKAFKDELVFRKGDRLITVTPYNDHNTGDLTVNIGCQ
ncbi:MAG: hypothetical protein FWD53_03415 [Phycisphaerales bacterium]|nr:hypothetical protein [Phycisphaerales bacterium]